MSTQLGPDFVRSLPFHITTQLKILRSDAFTTTQKSLVSRWGVVQHGGRTQHIHSAVEIKCFCLRNIDTGVGPYHQKLSNLCVFYLWLLFSSWDICILFFKFCICFLLDTSSSRILEMNPLLCSHMGSFGHYPHLVPGSWQEKLRRKSGASNSNTAF